MLQRIKRSKKVFRLLHKVSFLKHQQTLWWGRQLKNSCDIIGSEQALHVLAYVQTWLSLLVNQTHAQIIQ